MRSLICMMALVLSLSACASGAVTENMAISATAENKLTFDKKLVSQIEVKEIEGGRETNPMWKTAITDAAFKEALEKSLATYGLFSEDGNYQVSAAIVDLKRPTFGVSFKVISTVKYTLVETKTQKIIFEDTIVAEYTAAFADAFIGVERLRLAVEGSAKENIKEFLDALAKLEM